MNITNVKELDEALQKTLKLWLTELELPTGDITTLTAHIQSMINQGYLNNKHLRRTNP